MPVQHRQDHSGGWNPSQDLVQGDPRAYVRFDNLALDDRGAITLRRGSRSIGATEGSGVHTLFSTTLTDNLGTRRQRFAVAGNNVYRSETVGIWVPTATLDGAGDAHFTADKNFVFMTRGDTHWKTDAFNTRLWGLEGPAAAPTLTAVPSNGTVIATFGDDEGAVWEATEGTIDSASGADGSPNGARSLDPDPISGKGTIRRVFSLETDFSTYEFDERGTDEDLVEFYVWIGKPDNLEYLELKVDVNGDSDLPEARFRDDYYFHEFTLDQAVEMRLDKTQILSDVYEVEGYQRENAEEAIEERWVPRGVRVRRETPSDTGGWAKFSIPRGRFERVGSTPTKNWSTVKAVQLSAKYTLGEGITPGQLRFDRLELVGGEDHPLTGRFKARCVLAAIYSKHTVLSAPSQDSDEIELKANGLSVTVDVGDNFLQHLAGTSTDPVTEVWVYLMGGALRRYYRFATRGVQQGVVTVSVTKSQRTALIEDTVLEADNLPPPDDIIGILEGPHYDRTLVVAGDTLHLSRRNNPESYSVKQRLPLGKGNGSFLWIRRQGEEVLVGTTVDVFRLEGTGAEFPDGTVDFRLRRLNINRPPYTDAVATEGNTLVYLAADGLRLLVGGGSAPLRGAIDLLMILGEVRYGVSAVNLGGAPGRFRAGIWNNRLYVLVPEGVTISPSNVVWVHDFNTKLWYRWTHPSNFLTLYAEYDGSILCGASSGEVWELENVTTTGDGGTPIPVEMWTISDADGKPLSYKEAFDYRADFDSGGRPLTVALHRDEQATPAATLSLSSSGLGIGQRQLHLSLASWRRVQARLSGSFFTFKFTSHTISYRDRPLPRLHWDCGFPDTMALDYTWVRNIRVKGRFPVDAEWRVHFEGSQYCAGVIDADVYPGVETHHDLPVGRFCKGRQFRLAITSTTNDEPGKFELYWVEVTYYQSGARTQQRTARLPVST